MWNKEGFTPPDGGYGWVIVLCFICINSCLLPLTQSIGIIYEQQFQIMNITASQISFMLHLNNFIMCSLGLISGPLLKKFDYRQVSFFGAVLVCIGTFLTVFATSYISMVVTVSIIIGIGQGILMPGMYIAVNAYFKKRLTLAVSIQVTGASLSQIIMPQMCHYLLNLYGIQGTVLILSGIALHAIPATFLVRPIKHKICETDEVVTPDKQHVSERLLSPVYQETTYPAKNKQSKRNKFIKMLDLGLFVDRVYVIIVIGMGISFVAELNVIYMTPFILSELSKFTNEQIANALSIQGIFDLIGRLIIPFLAHKIEIAPKLMYMLSLIGSSLARTILATLYDHPNVILFGFSSVLGLAKGVKAVYQSVIIPKFVSREKLAAATGLSMLVNGILSVIIGPLIGLSHDLSNSYVSTLYIASCLSLFCVLLWTGEFLFTFRSNKTENVATINTR